MVAYSYTFMIYLVKYYFTQPYWPSEICAQKALECTTEHVANQIFSGEAPKNTPDKRGIPPFVLSPARLWRAAARLRRPAVIIKI